MPRYYFDVLDAKGLHRDEIGDELKDFEEAREQAQGLLPDIVYRGKLTYEGKQI